MHYDVAVKNIEKRYKELVEDVEVLCRQILLDFGFEECGENEWSNGRQTIKFLGNEIVAYGENGVVVRKCTVTERPRALLEMI